jgi:hypothetical protein
MRSTGQAIGKTYSRQMLRLAALLFAIGSGVVSNSLRTCAQGNLSVPIVHVSGSEERSEDGSHGLLVGATSGWKWIQDKWVHASLKSGRVYRFYSLTSFVQQSAGAKPELDEASGGAWWISFKQLKGSKSSLLGIAGSWNALPRPVKSVSETQPIYLNVVAEVLKKNGLTSAKPHISKIVRVDLEGNGQETVIIEASSPDLYHEPFAETTLKQGGYCFIIVRTPFNGKVKTLVLKGDYSGNKSGSMGANVFRLSHVLDLNGRGEMEIVVDWNYYEGGGVDVYRLKNGQAHLVLSAVAGA